MRSTTQPSSTTRTRWMTATRGTPTTLRLGTRSRPRSCCTRTSTATSTGICQDLRQPPRAPGVGVVQPDRSRGDGDHPLGSRRSLSEARQGLRRQRSDVLRRGRRAQEPWPYAPELPLRTTLRASSSTRTARSARPQVRGCRAEALEEIEGPAKSISVEMCQKFSGPHKNYHNDVEEAAQARLPGHRRAGHDVALLHLGDDDGSASEPAGSQAGGWT